MWIQSADISYVDKLSLLPVFYENDPGITPYSCPVKVPRIRNNYGRAGFFKILFYILIYLFISCSSTSTLLSTLKLASFSLVLKNSFIDLRIPSTSRNSCLFFYPPQ